MTNDDDRVVNTFTFFIKLPQIPGKAEQNFLSVPKACMIMCDPKTVWEREATQALGVWVQLLATLHVCNIYPLHHDASLHPSKFHRFCEPMKCR